jgi:hypothetical protein
MCGAWLSPKFNPLRCVAWRSVAKRRAAKRREAKRGAAAISFVLVAETMFTKPDFSAEMV